MISGNIMGCASSPPSPTPLHPPSHLHHHHCGDHVQKGCICNYSDHLLFYRVEKSGRYGPQTLIRNTQIQIHKYPSNVMMMPRGQWWERLGIKQHQLWDRPQSLLRSRTRPRTLKLLHRLHKVEHSFAITRWSENIFTCNHQPALTLIAQVYQVAQYRL